MSLPQRRSHRTLARRRYWAAASRGVCALRCVVSSRVWCAGASLSPPSPPQIAPNAGRRNAQRANVILAQDTCRRQPSAAMSIGARRGLAMPSLVGRRCVRRFAWLLPPPPPLVGRCGRLLFAIASTSESEFTFTVAFTVATVTLTAVRLGGAPMRLPALVVAVGARNAAAATAAAATATTILRPPLASQYCAA